MEDAYYAVSDTSKPLPHFYDFLRQAEFNFWRAFMPDIDTDFDQACEQLSRETGLGVRKVGSIILGVHRVVDELPRLYAVLKKHWHLDLQRICAIDTALAPLGPDIPPETLEFLDEEIARMLTPTIKRQELPGPRTIANKIKDLIQLVDEELPRTAPQPTTQLSTDLISTNTVLLTLQAPVEEVAAASRAIATKAEQMEVTEAEALLALLRGEEAPNVTIYLYVPKGEAEPAGFIPGYGWVDPQTVERLREGARIVDLEEGLSTDAYRPTEKIRKYVEGRDGKCIWPGCEKPAEKCQLDHRHNYADGGATAPNNLFCLCQHHHNVKTDRQAQYIVDPDTDIVYWLFADGTWIASETVQGPIGNWRQTVRQRILKRRDNARKRALQDQPQSEHFPDEPPPDNAPPDALHDEPSGPPHATLTPLPTPPPPDEPYPPPKEPPNDEAPPEELPEAPPEEPPEIAA